MRFDMANWEKGMQVVAARLEAGVWRHGLKTWDAVDEAATEGKVARRLEAALPRALPKLFRTAILKLLGKDGDIREHGLYYFAQRCLKGAYSYRVGASGGRHWVRKFWCVPHGYVEGELDENGKPRKPPKEGLWLRFEDLNPTDVQWLVKKYNIRKTDSAANRRLIWTAQDKSLGMPNTITMNDIMDDILAAM